MTALSLLHLNGTNGSTTFTDAVGTLTYARGGSTAVLDTGTVKFGTAALNVPSGNVTSSTFTAITTWTFDCWVQFSSVAGTHGIFAIIGGDVNGNVTGATHNGNGSGISWKVSYTGNAADLSVTGSKTTWATGQWYHLAMTYDTVAGKYYFYVDGVKDAEAASGTGMSGAGAVIQLGNNGVGQALNGWLDEVRYTNACEYPSGTTFSVQTSEYALGSTITPDTGALILTGSLATVSNSGQRQITPNTGALTLTGPPPNITSWRTVNAGAVLLTGYAPSLFNGITLTPGAGSLSLTGTIVNVGGRVSVLMRAYSGFGSASGGAYGAASLNTYQSSGSAASGNAGYGTPVLRKYAATGYAGYISNPVLRAYVATGRASGVAVGAATLRSYKSVSIAGAPRLRKYAALGYASATIAEVYRTHAMNTANNAVTEYANHRFNSYAQIGAFYYGAGPDGLIRLDGADDAGTNIDWKVRTGQIDDEQTGLKRLPEVVLGLRASGPVRVRVYPDDNQYFDYMLPNVKTDTIRQYRVKPGKGMRSRYFMVELQGTSNAAMELDSLQMNMTPTTRRIG